MGRSHRMKRFLFLALVSTISIPLSFQASAQDEEDLEYLDEAVRSGYRGAYREAAADLEDYLYDFPESLRALEALVFVERSRGRYEEALERAEERVSLSPQDANALAALSKMLALHGRYEEAESRLREALKEAPASLRVRFLLSRLLFYRGRRDEARELAKESVRLHPRESLDGDGLVHLSRLYDLMGDLDRAALTGVYADEKLNGRKGPKYRYERYEALLVLGDIYRRTRLGHSSGDKGSGNRALDCFRDALKINSNQVEALLGMARTRYYAFKFRKAHDLLDKALALNPHHQGAVVLKAHLLTVTRQYEAALGLLEKGLAVNSRDKALLSQKGAVLYLLGDQKGWEEAMAKALETDPLYGEGYYTLGELLIFHYRFTESEEQLRRCLEIDPDFNEAYILLGRTLANLGREEEARQALLESEKRDPFNYPWRNNMLRVLSDLDTFLEVESDFFKAMLDVDEAGVMRHYLLKWGQESMDILQEKYAFDPDVPVLLEMFPENEDFAVRTMGFTGLGALGACFGRVVTLLSPRAKPFRGGFCWACTLHHELCHVYTLQMSRNRIPRWFTEGISVFEEGQLKKSWRRNLDADLFNNYHNDALFRLENFDGGFMGPRILFAYYQAGLTVEFIVERFGQDRLLDMIRAFGKDLSTKGVVRRVLSMDLEEFDAAFREWVWEEKLSPLRCQPDYEESMREEFIDRFQEDPGDVENLIKAAWATFRKGKSIDAQYYLNKLPPEHSEGGLVILLKGEIAYARKLYDRAESYYKQAIEAGVEDLFAYRNLGKMSWKKGEGEEAVAYLEKAKKCFPSYIGPGSPRFLLMDIYTEQDKKDEAHKEMEELLEQGILDISMVLKVASHHARKEAWEKATAYLEEAVRIDPFRRPIHVDLAKALRKTERYDAAMEELRIALEIKPSTEPQQGESLFSVVPIRDENAQLADIHAEMGAVHLELGRIEEAKEEIDKALSLKADHEAALALKKKLSDADSR